MTAMNTAADAYKIAIHEVRIENNQPRLVSTELVDGLYHMNIMTTFVAYEFYVDAVTGEVLGISTQPVEGDAMEAETCTRPIAEPARIKTVTYLQDVLAEFRQRMNSRFGIA